MEYLDRLQGRVSNPTKLFEDIQTKVGQLGEDYGPEEVVSLAEFVITMISGNKQRVEVEEELQDVMQNAAAFSQWLFNYLETEAKPKHVTELMIDLDDGDESSSSSSPPKPVGSNRLLSSAISATAKQHQQQSSPTAASAGTARKRAANDDTATVGSASTPADHQPSELEATPESQPEGKRSFKVQKIVWDLEGGNQQAPAGGLHRSLGPDRPRVSRTSPSQRDEPRPGPRLAERVGTRLAEGGFQPRVSPGPMDFPPGNRGGYGPNGGAVGGSVLGRAGGFHGPGGYPGPGPQPGGPRQGMMMQQMGPRPPFIPVQQGQYFGQRGMVPPMHQGMNGWGGPQGFQNPQPYFPQQRQQFNGAGGGPGQFYGNQTPGMGVYRPGQRHPGEFNRPHQQPIQQPYRPQPLSERPQYLPRGNAEGPATMSAQPHPEAPSGGLPAAPQPNPHPGPNQNSVMTAGAAATTSASTGSIACRFGANCTRADCKYSHPSPAAIAAAAAAAAASAPRCRYWPNCLNPSCTFFHPPPGSAAAIGTGANPSAYTLANVPCRFEPFCTRPGCPYQHSGGPKAAGSSATGAAGANRSVVFKGRTNDRAFAVGDEETEAVKVGSAVETEEAEKTSSATAANDEEGKQA
ncbi:hypothetical protein DFJ73DRAFT_251503 [Zopfochytrium polystomum]|nr:hypothetical protein DFJ73DRAFT_251503 [Zopfochytrium polystomum]